MRCLQQQILLKTMNVNIILNITPGEGSRPQSIFKDKFCEELVYPGIFLGEARPGNEKRLVKINYSDIWKSELRRSDRRCAKAQRGMSELLRKPCDETGENNSTIKNNR